MYSASQESNSRSSISLSTEDWGDSDGDQFREVCSGLAHSDTIFDPGVSGIRTWMRGRDGRTWSDFNDCGPFGSRYWYWALWWLSYFPGFTRLRIILFPRIYIALIQFFNKSVASPFWGVFIKVSLSSESVSSSDTNFSFNPIMTAIFWLMACLLRAV